MVNQRGSVLVGVLGISIVLTMAAGSLLMVAANSRSDEDQAFQRAACYLDAESGLQMGAEWLRTYQGATNADDIIKTNQGWAGKVLVPGTVFENGSAVTVTVSDMAGGKTLTSRAVRGTEAAQFSWDVGVDAGGTLARPNLALKNWRSP